MYETGKTEDNPDTKGLSIPIHPKIKESVTDLKTYSNRLSTVEATLQETVINAYAPTSDVEDAKVEQFYDNIQRAMAYSNSKYKIITGVSNAKLGTKTKEDFRSMGAFGIGERNETGDGLIEFAEEHKLIIANTEAKK